MVDEIYTQMVLRGIKWGGVTPTKERIKKTIDDMYRHYQETGESTFVGGLMLTPMLPGKCSIMMFMGFYEEE